MLLSKPASLTSVRSCSNQELQEELVSEVNGKGQLSTTKVTLASLASFQLMKAPPPLQQPKLYHHIQSFNSSDPSKEKPESMSAFMRLARKCNTFYFNGDLQHCRPFIVGDRQVGLVQPNVLEAIRRHPEAFWVDPASDGGVWLHPQLQTYDERSHKVDQVLRRWKQDALFTTLKGWREECYEVRTPAGFGEPPLMKMERAATCLFGIRQYGVDINGYTSVPQVGVCLWLQRRARSKPTWPGMWDNMAAGGLSVGHSVLQTALKETVEEASVPPHLLANLKAAGSVSFYFESERGLFPNTEFVYDLELPADFVPCNADGEVESFELVPVDQVMERILSSDFKTTSCPVTLDFLIRHGFLNSENEPHLPELVELLHLPLHLVYGHRTHSAAGLIAPNEPNGQ